MNNFRDEIRPPGNVLGDLCRMKKSSGHMLIQVQNYNPAPLLHTPFESIRYPFLAMNTLAVTDFSVD